MASDDEMTIDEQRATPGAGIGRRRAIGLLGTLGAGTVTGCGNGSSSSADEPSATPTPGVRPMPTPGALDCVVTPAETEGPYFVDEKLNRSDIRVDPATGAISDGLPLRLDLNVMRREGASCAPLAGAVVDVWHCDAAGVYSDVNDPGFVTVGRKFLRGYQVTDAQGKVEFMTIYPGWYQGRTVHIHFKIRSDPAAQRGYEFTSQLYFDDAVTDRVHAQPPYAARGVRTLRNDGDGIYRQGGSQLMVQLTPDGAGYLGTFDVELDVGAVVPTDVPGATATATDVSATGTPAPTATPTTGNAAHLLYLPELEKHAR
jgi:protocatechuate 3,4-dioxygenase beta subunit